MNEQAGIQAGDGGFDINVKGNTDLKGAYIASTATPDKNQLTTGTLSFSDIQNSSSYNASSFGISAGGGVDDGGSNYATHGQTSGKNTGGGRPLYVSESVLEFACRSIVQLIAVPFVLASTRRHDDLAEFIALSACALLTVVLVSNCRDRRAACDTSDLIGQRCAAGLRRFPQF